MRTVRRLAADRAGSAAAEMALVLPLLLVIMFGTFELGHFFYSEHIVQKAVRDAARYASRRGASATRSSPIVTAFPSPTFPLRRCSTLKTCR